MLLVCAERGRENPQLCLKHEMRFWNVRRSDLLFIPRCCFGYGKRMRKFMFSRWSSNSYSHTSITFRTRNIWPKTPTQTQIIHLLIHTISLPTFLIPSAYLLAGWPCLTSYYCMQWKWKALCSILTIGRSLNAQLFAIAKPQYGRYL